MSRCGYKTRREHARHQQGADGWASQIPRRRGGCPGSPAPSATHTIEEVVVAGDRAAVRLVWQGTHTGELQGVAATGKTIQMSETGFFRVVGGRVAEFWPLFDTLQLMTSAGVLSSEPSR